MHTSEDVCRANESQKSQMSPEGTTDSRLDNSPDSISCLHMDQHDLM